jgi:hypothetical protein
MEGGKCPCPVPDELQDTLHYLQPILTYMYLTYLITRPGTRVLGKWYGKVSGFRPAFSAGCYGIPVLATVLLHLVEGQFFCVS